MAMTFALEDSYSRCPRLSAISWSCERRARFSTSFAINMLLGHAMGGDQVVAVVFRLVVQILHFWMTTLSQPCHMVVVTQAMKPVLLQGCDKLVNTQDKKLGQLLANSSVAPGLPL